jgi:hypothetical protein
MTRYFLAILACLSICSLRWPSDGVARAVPVEPTTSPAGEVEVASVNRDDDGWRVGLRFPAGYSMPTDLTLYSPGLDAPLQFIVDDQATAALVQVDLKVA